MSSLSFTLHKTEADFAGIFFNTGGELSNAVQSAETLSHVSGGKEAIATNVDANGVNVTIPISADLPKEAMLVLMNQNKGVSIAGTLGRAYQGEAAVPIEELLANAQKGKPTVINAHYETSSAISATFVVSNVQLTGVTGMTGMGGGEDADEASNDEMEATQAALVAWANGGYERRSTQLVFPKAADLTKSVAHTAVGVGGSQYVLAHSLVNLPSTYSNQTLEALIKEAFLIELGGDETQLETLMRDAAQPGLAASAHAETLASAMSVISSLMVVYRADSAAVMLPGEVTSKSVESWLVPRGPLAANDCESSAFVALNALHACMDDKVEASAFPTMAAVKNILGNLYSPAICVLAAKGAEATNTTASSVAGHAIGMLVNNAHLLHALDEAVSNHALAEGVPYISDATNPTNPTALRVARETAVFGEAGMPVDALALPGMFAIEGTTPSNGRLLDEDAETAMRSDDVALQRLGSTIGRALRKLGGATHKFYSSFLDITVAPTHPLYADANLRSQGQATTQFCLSPKTKAKVVGTAGIHPDEAHKGHFLASPLHEVNTETGELLDRAEKVAMTHMMPGHKTVLDSFEEGVLAQNLAKLEALNAHLEGCTDTTGHGVAMVIPYSALVSNAASLDHMCRLVTEKARSGAVAVTSIPGLAQTTTGQEAGYAVSVSVKV
jgi:hypothetical protein